MGLCGSVPAGGSAESHRVDRELEEMHQQDQEILKLLLLGTGECGKCWHTGTQLMLYDGRTKSVEDIVEGESLMGDDSVPRIVQKGSLRKGRSTLYEIRSSTTANVAWKCNAEHILVLRWPAAPSTIACTDKEYSFSCFQITTTAGADESSVEQVTHSFPSLFEAESARSSLLLSYPASSPYVTFECPVDSFLRFSPQVQQAALLFQPQQVQFAPPVQSLQQRLQSIAQREIEQQELHLVARVLGSLYASSSSSSSTTLSDNALIQTLCESYHIISSSASPLLTSSPSFAPHAFPLDLLRESMEIRCAFLAGLLETGAQYHHNNKITLHHFHSSSSATNFERSQEHLPVREGLISLIRSVGLNVSLSSSPADGSSFELLFPSLNSLLAKLPSLDMSSQLAQQIQKAAQKEEDALSEICVPFTVTVCDADEWHGFTVDGNGRVLMSDYTISHNSTILKQMQIISGAGFTPKEVSTFREIIYANILESIQAMVRACGHANWSQPQSQSFANQLLAINSDAAVFPSAELLGLVQHFWGSEQALMQAAIASKTFTMLDSAPYFLDNVARVLSPGYKPTDADIVRARVRTTGVNEFTLHFNEDTFTFIDVGGQRGERKKWIHAFSDVAALFYVASLSEYDQNLVEDPTRNRMAESLSLFEGIIHQRWFVNTPIILFLNKHDLFVEKIKHTDLGLFCPDYTGGCNADLALAWIKATFLSLSRLPSKQIYVHVTNATDTKGIQFVWKAAREIIIQENLKNLKMI